MLSRRVLVWSVGLLAITGCGAIRRMAGNDTVSLEKAEVKSMSVDIRKPQKTICPREAVQMGVFAEVVLEGEKQGKQVETWQGRGSVNKNDKLEFTEFAFHSDQGSFDADGWFSPTPNLLASAGKEFEIKSVYRRRPDKFSFTTTYKPDYGCIKKGGGGGPSGRPGASGSGGEAGRAGQSASSTAAGGDGGPGGNGTQGGNGTDGGPGPRLQVYATIVKTAFYDRLTAVIIDGDAKDFLLVPDGQPITISAHGGPGGPGGQGGHGGQGGGGGAGNPGGQGGHGGQGGSGGQGGNGGPGGQIDLVVDSAHPELRSLVRLDVGGGSAGPPGGGGSPGTGGYGGQGLTPSSQNGVTPPPAQAGQRGADGTSGASGTQGNPGPNGRANATAGNVKERFAHQAEITPL